TRGYVSIRPNPFPIVEEYECQYLSIIGATCNVVFVRHAHKLGLHVMVWSVNDASVIATLHKLKVDSVITDYPSMAIPLLGRLSKNK
ncbi:MAG: glycerophosphodiester phosphodiesterase, partial [Pseudomonadales bacterium]